MLVDLGFIDYESAYGIQKGFVNRVKSGEEDDCLIIAEHPAVFTIGRTGSMKNMLVGNEFLAENNIKVLNVDRGGDITFHGPGQVVMYPIINLAFRHRDLHRYLRDLEEVVIRSLHGYGISAGRISGRTGVWAFGKKISSVGVAASNWVTFHGLSLNVNVELDFFSMINPCGMKGVAVTSMKEILKRNISLKDVKDSVVTSFCNVFDIRKEHFADIQCPALA